MKVEYGLPQLQHKCTPAIYKIRKYSRKIIKFNQMDFQFACWQMLYLFTAPRKVFQSCSHRKQAKDQYARDDPAFFLLFGAFLVFTATGFAIIFKSNHLQFLMVLLQMLFVYYIGVGIAVATFYWYVLNKYFRIDKHVQDIEWGFAFDVHLTSLLPLVLLTQTFQLLFYNNSPDRTAFCMTFFGNTIWLLGIAYYNYITFLGYSSLRILYHIRALLFPIPVCFILYVISVLFNFNITYFFFTFYKSMIF